MKHPTQTCFGAVRDTVTPTRQPLYYSGIQRLCDNKPERKHFMCASVCLW